MQNIFQGISLYDVYLDVIFDLLAITHTYFLVVDYYQRYTVSIIEDIKWHCLSNW